MSISKNITCSTCDFTAFTTAFVTTGTSSLPKEANLSFMMVNNSALLTILMGEKTGFGAVACPLASSLSFNGCKGN